MSKFLSPNAVRIVAFIAIFLSSANVFCGNDTIPSSPQTAEEWFNKGYAALGLSQYDETIKCFEKSIEYFEKAPKLNPSVSAVYYNLALAYADGRRDYDKAIECYKKAIEINPNLVPAYRNLGAVYAESKQDNDEAIKYYKKAIELSPNYAPVYFNLGLAYDDGKEDYAKAIEYYEKAVKLKPDYAKAYLRLANVYVIQGNEEKALGYLKEAAKLGDKTAQQWLQGFGVSEEETDEP